jgi:hypothetical protein
MRISLRSASVLICVALLFAGAALGGEGVHVKIANDGVKDLVVTVYDMNTKPQRVVLENARMNGFTSVPVNLLGDTTGRAKLSWTATSKDGVSLKCGHDEASVLDASEVTVHADSECTA